MAIAQLLYGLWAIETCRRLLTSLILAYIVNYHGYTAVILQVNISGPFHLIVPGPLRTHFGSFYHFYLAQVYISYVIPLGIKAISKLLNVAPILHHFALYWPTFLVGANIYVILLVLRAVHQVWTASKTGNIRYTRLVLVHQYLSLLYPLVLIWIMDSMTAYFSVWDRYSRNEEMVASDARWVKYMAAQIVPWFIVVVLSLLRVFVMQRARLLRILGRRIRWVIWNKIRLVAPGHRAGVEDLQSPDKFHYFTRLPKEAQIRIFKLAILPRVIKVDASRTPSVLDNVIWSDWTYSPTVQTHIPRCNPDIINHGLLQACQMSKDAFLRARSELAFVQLRVHGPKIFFDSQHDTVFITAGLASFLELQNIDRGPTTLLNPLISPDLSGLRNLTVTFDDLWNLWEEGNVAWLLNLSGLQTLNVVTEFEREGIMVKRHYLVENLEKSGIVVFLERKVVALWKRQVRLRPEWTSPKIKSVRLMIDE